MGLKFIQIIRGLLYEIIKGYMKFKPIIYIYIHKTMKETQEASISRLINYCS